MDLLLENIRTLLRLAAVALLLTSFSLSASSALPASAIPALEEECPTGKELKLPVAWWHDPDVPTKAIVVGIHGMTFYAEAFENLATYLASEGYPFYAADMRGFGRWKSDSDKYPSDNKFHFTQSIEDLVKVVTSLRKQYPDKRIILVGESLGANIGLLLAVQHPELVDGLILSGPCYVTQIHPRLRWGVDFVHGVFHPYGPMNLEPYINPYLSHDRLVTKSCLIDPMMCRYMSVADLIKASKTNRDAIKDVENIPSNLPILILCGKLDQVFKTKDVPKLVSRIGSTQKSLCIVPDKGHLLLEHQPIDAKIEKVIEMWLAVQEPANQELVKATAVDPAE